MMRFPSQLPRSRTTKVMRLAVALAALAVLAASIFGLAYALKPAPVDASEAWSAPPAGLQTGDPAGAPAMPGDGRGSGIAHDASVQGAAGN